jgi:hypothetical protein
MQEGCELRSSACSNTKRSKVEEQFNVAMQEGQDLKNNATKTSAHAIKKQQE